MAMIERSPVRGSGGAGSGGGGDDIPTSTQSSALHPVTHTTPAQQLEQELVAEQSPAIPDPTTDDDAPTRDDTAEDTESTLPPNRLEKIRAATNRVSQRFRRAAE